jgi:hypothetical protein
MNFEWLRFITIALAVLVSIQLIMLYRKSKAKGIITFVLWFLLIIVYDIFKFIVRDDLCYYNISVIWVNLIYIYGIVMLGIAGYLFKDIKTWTQH